jgi:HEAT repeat protein
VPSVRASAATALGRLHDRRALESLLWHAQEDQFEVAEAAAHAAAAVDLEAASRVAAAEAAGHLAQAVDLARLA